MATDELELAICIPEALVQDVDAFIRNHPATCAIERKQAGSREVDEDLELGFDPGTGSALIWIVLKLVGTAVVDVALGILANTIYESLKARTPAGRASEILVRLRSGETVAIPIDAPLEADQLKALLTDSTNQ